MAGRRRRRPRGRRVGRGAAGRVQREGEDRGHPRTSRFQHRRGRGREGAGVGRRRRGRREDLRGGVATPIPDRDLLLIRMLPPPDEGSDATTSPLAPSASSRRVPSFADLDEMRGRRLAQGGPSSPAAGLDSREHASLLDFVTRVVNGRRGCSLSLFGYYEPTAGGSGPAPGVSPRRSG